MFLGGSLFAADQPKFEPLPVPISNNAVASVKSRGSLLLYSMMGMGPKKTWDAISNSGYMIDSESRYRQMGLRCMRFRGRWDVWRPRRSAPASIFFLFGGYVVDAQGGETTLPDVNAYEPLTDRWFRAEDMPVAVDDSVAGALSRPLHLPGGRLVEDGRGARRPGIRRREEHLVTSHADSRNACVWTRRRGGRRHHCVH